MSQLLFRSEKQKKARRYDVLAVHPQDGVTYRVSSFRRYGAAVERADGLALATGLPAWVAPKGESRVLHVGSAGALLRALLRA